VDPIEAEELTLLPGAEEVLALLEVRDHVRSGRWDVIVVDCAPTAETLRLLALPEALNWYMDRISQRRAQGDADLPAVPEPYVGHPDAGRHGLRRVAAAAERPVGPSARCWPGRTRRCGWC